MPPKIRKKILAYVVGGQTVHVKFVPHEEAIHLEDCSPVPISAIGIFRHAACVAKETEWDAYAQSARTYVLKYRQCFGIKIFVRLTFTL